MLQWLWLVPFFPFFGFVLLISASGRMPKSLVTIIGAGSIGLAALVTAFVAVDFLSNGLSYYQDELWIWMEVGNFQPGFSLYLDGLSLSMLFVITGVGFLIHVYASAYMYSDDDFPRFFTYTNLFVAAMIMLVLADNLVLLFLGWEGVGLCSFLLIGFWYKDPANGLAARKAFVVTRVGDTAFAIGLFLLFKHVGTLDIQEAMVKAKMLWTEDNTMASIICALLLGGAVGKSAQLPLQTWLPDAMAGPTPVSALIHAATMVTAGVYLIARMQGIFLLSPEVMSYVAWVGASTLLLAGFAALAQTDIKRVLAYSTMSQIGYMMLALGAGAWSAGVFHLMTHAFFKALLFLTAGSVILALHHQQNLFKMGGLLKKLPVESGLFIVGLICLMALPGTSGFFSKEAIIATLWSSPTAGPLLWWAAILGALLTSIYSCRLFFLGFLGDSRQHDNVHDLHNDHPTMLLRWPLFLLALLSLFGGLISLDFSAVFSSALSSENAASEPAWLHPLAIATPFIGIAFSWFFFKSYRSNKGAALEVKSGILNRFCGDGLGFDWLYRYLLVRPYCFLANINRRDIIDQLIMLNGWYVRLWHDALSASQNGSLRWYAAGIGLAIVFLAGVITL